MHPQYKYKGENRYFSFQERHCGFNQSKINRIMESASDELINRNMANFDENNLLLRTLNAISEDSKENPINEKPKEDPYHYET